MNRGSLPLDIPVPPFKVSTPRLAELVSSYKTMYLYHLDSCTVIVQGVQECSIPCFRKILKISNQQ